MKWLIPIFFFLLLALQTIFFTKLLSEGVGFESLLDFSTIDWLFFNKLHLLLFPIYIFILILNIEKIRFVDFSFFYIPPVIWFGLIFLGGSGANHMIVNPSMISCVSGLYLLRFYLKYFESKPIKGVVLLWLLIFVICSIIHMVLPIFPE